MAQTSLLITLLFAIGVITIDAWVTSSPQSRQKFASCQRSTILHAAGADDNDKGGDQCTWQDIWNYDCAMSNVYSATFVAQDWIKSMPCAVGLADDCETPDELKLPGPSVGSGVGEVDVMGFLNLKRAASLKKSDE
eukprot:CAMPEP_0198250174 /NCGR_PEP_ID=MMETSP1447-20131203/1465_1 /TAXON_ID=420782 /ORGANISM="Chaetoceros dichaeta, Strain CCMP1751" /LENGTH=135 /DNA_ID=CAMNT_0043934975 /DNA_START=69 /DNA_END=476 /DNA_ORIENTATION=+